MKIINEIPEIQIGIITADEISFTFNAGITQSACSRFKELVAGAN
jgi:hypothetical protein